jgi:hypothetical protein
MSTITTTNLSWSATWSQAPVMPDALNVVIYGRQALQHGNSVVSSSSETSSAYDDKTGDTVALSREAQTYIDTQSSGIAENSTLSKIYGAIVQVLNSSTASDSEKWNAFVADQRLAMESARNDGIWGANINVFGDTEAMATPYMQKIKAAYDDLDSNNNIASNQMERNINGLFQQEAEADLDEIWGNSSLSVNVTQITAQTGSGNVTSFSISSELSGKMEYAVGTGPNIKQALVKTDVNSPTSFSAYDSDQVVKISGNKYDLKAEFEKEVVDELFGSSAHKSMADKSAARQKTDATAEAGAAGTSGTGSVSAT